MADIITTTIAGDVWHWITLKQGNTEVTLLDYGAAIASIKVPDRLGNIEEVLLCYANPADWKDNDRHLNATIGPTAGRIRDGHFVLDGIPYQLAKNFQGKHNLHGGDLALSRTRFRYEVLEEEGRSTVAFTTLAKDLGHGYPGNRTIQIIYTIEDGLVQIEFVAETDAPTLLNLSNHAYFNLSGDLKRTILSHRMTLDASRKMVLDEEMIPIGVTTVDETPYDFRIERPIDDGTFVEIDDPYLLDDVDPDRIQATLYDPESGRQLEVLTTYPAIVCYTDNFPMPYELAFGAPNVPHMGICFEAQNPPGGIHLPEMEDSILRPDSRYYHKTRFLFSTRE
jgi:aldose 1-epimerase